MRTFSFQNAAALAFAFALKSAKAGKRVKLNRDAAGWRVTVTA